MHRTYVSIVPLALVAAGVAALATVSRTEPDKQPTVTAPRSQTPPPRFSIPAQPLLSALVSDEPRPASSEGASKRFDLATSDLTAKMPLVPQQKEKVRRILEVASQARGILERESNEETRRVRLEQLDAQLHHALATVLSAEQEEVLAHHIKAAGSVAPASGGLRPSPKVRAER